MTDSKIRIYLGCLTAVPLHIWPIQASNDSVRHGQNKEKEKNRPTELNFFAFEKFSRRKIITFCYCVIHNWE